jgi:hypothetical protein
MSAGVTIRAARLVGDDVVAETIRDTLPAVTHADGSIAWRNRFRVFVAKRSETGAAGGERQISADNPVRSPA